MHSKRLGNIGEAKVLTKFVENQIPVYLPFGDNEKADLIIDLNNHLLKIQVKTCEKIDKENNCIPFSISYTANNRKNITCRYDENEIDYFALYSLELDKIFLVPVNKVGKRVFYIRLDKKSECRQKKNVHFAEDYYIENFL